MGKDRVTITCGRAGRYSVASAVISVPGYQFADGTHERIETYGVNGGEHKTRALALAALRDGGLTVHECPDDCDCREEE